MTAAVHGMLALGSHVTRSVVREAGGTPGLQTMQAQLPNESQTNPTQR
jgi:hypothetical protein